MFELGIFLGVCFVLNAVISFVDRFGGEQDYSG